ncbi:hypothetical protein FACS1894170_04480 [Planctomycetales bacterium]|nr:hypothetical protein FACS1894170_04480 [Planctomycetales bacterium]
MFRPIVFLLASKFYYDIFNQFVDMNPLCTARLIVMMLDWAYNSGRDIEFFPILKIHGQNDWLLPVDHICPDIVILRAGHCLTLSHPDIINQLIFEFSKKWQPVSLSMSFETSRI